MNYGSNKTIFSFICEVRTFVVFDCLLHDGEVKLDVMFVVANNPKELKLVLIQQLKQPRRLYISNYNKYHNVTDKV